MLFRRRNNLPLWRQIGGWLWPRSGLKRAWTYLFHRVGRMPGSTHSIAAGIACGAAVSFTPFLGLHFLLAFALAWLVRGNMLAAAFGTIVGNPWTFPFIFALTGQVGSFLLGHDGSAMMPLLSLDTVWTDPSSYFASVLPPFLVGSLPIGFLVWLVVYVAFRSLISGYRESRIRRRHQRMAERETNGKDSM